MSKKRLFQAVQIALTIALIIFIAMKAQSFIAEVDWGSVRNVVPSIMLAALFFAMGYVVLAQHWLLVAREIVPKTPSRQRLAFFASQPYKYLPTSFFTLSFRALYAKKLGMSVRDSTKAQLVENMNIVASAFLIATVALVVLVDIRYGVLVLVGIAGVFAFLWKNHHINIRIYKTDSVLHMRCWIKAFLLAMLAWFLVGVGFFLLATSLQANTTFLNSLIATGYAFGAGILAVFAPGGIGVREAIFSSFGFIASTVVVWRCITFVVDLLLGAISIALIRYSR